MKKILILLINIFIFGALYSNDTIKVSNNIAATCKFGVKVERVVYGNNPNNKYFEDLIVGKNVILRSKTEISPIITVTFFLENGDAEVVFLMYDKLANKAIYNFIKEEKISPKKEEENLVRINEEQQNKKDSIMYMNRMKELSKMNDIYFDLVEEKNKMEFQVTKIMNDKNYTYLELIINNKSGGAFEIDGISFTYEEGKSKSVKKDTKKREERLFPKYESNKYLVAAYTKEVFEYIIPLFNVQKNGMLVILIKEKKGTRDYRIEIEGSVLLKVDVFE